MKSIRNKIFVLAVYAIAMALVEAAVVIYLRELYYSAGFVIQSVSDLKVIPRDILRVEVWREIATIIMLMAVSLLAFPEARRRFWGFVLAFSVWDLCYYLFLYIFLRWPASLGTLDIYFLIPYPWIGPVWLPLLFFSVAGVLSAKMLLREEPVQ